MERKNNDDTATVVAELFELCAYRLRVFEFASDLSQAQWAALRYFARCNPGAANITSYADLHKLTGGTASRTVAHLVRKDLLSRASDSRDRRRKPLQVTTKGRLALDRDPLHGLIAGFREAESASLRMFAELLDKVINLLERGTIER